MKNTMFLACSTNIILSISLYGAAQKTFPITIAVTEQAKALMTKTKALYKLSLSLQCKQTDDIEDLKKVIHTATGMSIDQQQLSFMVAPCYLPLKKMLSNNDMCINYIKPTGSIIELGIIDSANTKK